MNGVVASHQQELRVPADSKPEPSAPADDPKQFRRLKWNELVSHGDFVANDQSGFDLWEGPCGFRADSFVKPIYRKLPRRPVAAKNLK